MFINGQATVGQPGWAAAARAEQTWAAPWRLALNQCHPGFLQEPSQGVR